MAISTYEKDGKKLWSVYVNLRSKNDPKLRIQKRILGIESEEEAILEEKRTLRKIAEQIIRIESQGDSWETIIEKWETAMWQYGHYHRMTVRDHVACLRNWTKDWLKKTAADLNKGDGRAVLTQLEAEGKSISFQKRVKNTVNVVYNWAIEQQYIRNVQSSPVQGS